MADLYEIYSWHRSCASVMAESEEEAVQKAKVLVDKRIQDSPLLHYPLLLAPGIQDDCILFQSHIAEEDFTPENTRKRIQVSKR